MMFLSVHEPKGVAVFQPDQMTHDPRNNGRNYFPQISPKAGITVVHLDSHFLDPKKRKHVNSRVLQPKDARRTMTVLFFSRCGWPVVRSKWRRGQTLLVLKIA